MHHRVLQEHRIFCLVVRMTMTMETVIVLAPVIMMPIRCRKKTSRP